MAVGEQYAQTGEGAEIVSQVVHHRPEQGVFQLAGRHDDHEPAIDVIDVPRLDNLQGVRRDVGSAAMAVEDGPPEKLLQPVADRRAAYGEGLAQFSFGGKLAAHGKKTALDGIGNA